MKDHIIASDFVRKSNIAAKTQGNAVFISAIEKRNIDDLRKKILNKVRALYKNKIHLQKGAFLIIVAISQETEKKKSIACTQPFSVGF